MLTIASSRIQRFRMLLSRNETSSQIYLWTTSFVKHLVSSNSTLPYQRSLLSQMVANLSQLIRLLSNRSDSLLLSMRGESVVTKSTTRKTTKTCNLVFRCSRRLTSSQLYNRFPLLSPLSLSLAPLLLSPIRRPDVSFNTSRLSLSTLRPFPTRPSNGSVQTQSRITLSGISKYGSPQTSQETISSTSLTRAAKISENSRTSLRILNRRNLQPFD